VVVPFDVQKLFNLMKSHLSIATLISREIGAILRKFLHMPVSSNIFLFSYSRFKGTDITFLRSLIHFELFLYRMRDMTLISIFYMWKLSFSNTICWRGCLFLNNTSGIFVKYCCSCMGLFLDLPFYSIGLCVCFCVTIMLF
jgi:hypothetical protein